MRPNVSADKARRLLAGWLRVESCHMRLSVHEAVMTVLVGGLLLTRPLADPAAEEKTRLRPKQVVLSPEGIMLLLQSHQEPHQKRAVRMSCAEGISGLPIRRPSHVVTGLRR